MARARSDKVEIIGLADVQKALRAADPELAKQLRVRQKSIAEKVVAKATARGDALGGVAAKSTQALKAKAEQRASKILLDGDKFPWALGGEFGGLGYPQFEPWKGNQYTDPLGQDVGYFLHPTLRDMRNDIIDEYEDMVRDLLARVAKA